MRRPSFVRCDAQPSQRSCGACAKLIAIRWRAPDAPVPAHRTFEADVFEWPTRGWVWPTSPLINDRTATRVLPRSGERGDPRPGGRLSPRRDGTGLSPCGAAGWDLGIPAGSDRSNNSLARPARCVNSTWPPVGGFDVTIIFVRPAMAAETIANGKERLR
jgi:hypothetical protein